MPAAAPAVLLHSLDTQQGVSNIILAMTRRDVGKPAFSLRKKRFVKTHALSLLGTTRLLSRSERISSTLRDSDIPARLGGDEFALLLPETDADGAAPVAEKILKKLQEPYIFNEWEFTLGGSIGIAVYPQNANNAEALVHLADTAMYHAKQEKLGVSFYSESMQQKTIG